ncbi:PucR family transcriptional regulator [Amycolatopsis suaedae]|uniref:PucR family transcriptional regulator n=1 Tax=Amycolatopsis suaedae TaxID=2510978 RepID=UPI0013EEF523|nr:PucR family transcriptional regulator [Amycolatopsis suaedae]
MRFARSGTVMPLTVADVLRMDGLELGLLAGEAGLGREVSWAHAIEVADPVPWLRGGELVLTIGLGLPDDESGRRAYVRRLAAAGAAGLGFAAEVLDALPPEVLDEAGRRDLPVVAVLGTTPFIAVSQAVARWHSEAALRAERHAIAVQESIARAALRSGDAGILAELARGVGGEALLLDVDGRTRAARPAGERPWHARARELAGSIRGRSQAATAVEDGEKYLLVHSIGLAGPPRGWLALSCPPGDAVHQRLLANHAAVLLAMTMLGLRALRSALHAQRARLLAPLLDGAPVDAALLPPEPLEVVVFALDGAAEPVGVLLDALADVAAGVDTDRILLVPRPGGVVAVLPAQAGLGARVRDRAAELTGAAVRAGAAVAGDVTGVAAAARRAADVLPSGESYVDADAVSSWGLLRASDVLAPFSAAVLGPLRDHDRRTGADLAATLRAYLDAGSVEAAAAVLGVHRNTIRTRLRSAERVAGRSLDSPRDRLELWLALSADDI